jgi:hypothetical protein
MLTLQLAGAGDVVGAGSLDRRALRGSVCSMPVELVVEDGADGAVGERADLDGARGSGFESRDAEWSRQSQDAEARSEALLRMRALLEDEIAERRGGRADEGGMRPLWPKFRRERAGSPSCFFWK